MEWDEYELHSARRQIIKITGHLLDARRALMLTTDHSKHCASHNQTTKDIENNLEAIILGINDTIQFCATAADDFKKRMKEPNATPPPIFGHHGREHKLTPYQKQLIREKAMPQPITMPEYVATKAENKLPKLLKFSVQTPKPKHKRKVRKDEIIL